MASDEKSILFWILVGIIPLQILVLLVILFICWMERKKINWSHQRAEPTSQAIPTRCYNSENNNHIFSILSNLNAAESTDISKIPVRVDNLTASVTSELGNEDSVIRVSSSGPTRSSNLPSNTRTTNDPTSVTTATVSRNVTNEDVDNPTFTMRSNQRADSSHLDTSPNAEEYTEMSENQVTVGNLMAFVISEYDNEDLVIKVSRPRPTRSSNWINNNRTTNEANDLMNAGRNITNEDFDNPTSTTRSNQRISLSQIDKSTSPVEYTDMSETHVTVVDLTTSTIVPESVNEDSIIRSSRSGLVDSDMCYESPLFVSLPEQPESYRVSIISNSLFDNSATVV